MCTCAQCMPREHYKITCFSLSPCSCQKWLFMCRDWYCSLSPSPSLSPSLCVLFPYPVPFSLLPSPLSCTVMNVCNFASRSLRNSALVSPCADQVLAGNTGQAGPESIVEVGDTCDLDSGGERDTRVTRADAVKEVPVNAAVYRMYGSTQQHVYVHVSYMAYHTAYIIHEN